MISMLINIRHKCEKKIDTRNSEKVNYRNDYQNMEKIIMRTEKSENVYWYSVCVANKNKIIGPMLKRSWVSLVIHFVIVIKWKIRSRMNLFLNQAPFIPFAAILLLPKFFFRTFAWTIHITKYIRTHARTHPHTHAFCLKCWTEAANSHRSCSLSIAIHVNNLMHKKTLICVS